jgi:hypothetical protein
MASWWRRRAAGAAALKAFQDKLAAKIAEAGASPSDERVHQEIVLYARASTWTRSSRAW